VSPAARTLNTPSAVVMVRESLAWWFTILLREQINVQLLWIFSQWRRITVSRVVYYFSESWKSSLFLEQKTVITENKTERVLRPQYPNHSRCLYFRPGEASGESETSHFRYENMESFQSKWCACENVSRLLKKTYEYHVKESRLCMNAMWRRCMGSHHCISSSS
jgi:hypothetical protein